MAKDTDPRTRPATPTRAADVTSAGAKGTKDVSAYDVAPPASASPRLAPQRPPRRRPRPWTLILFVAEVALVVGLVWFSWSSGSWS